LCFSFSKITLNKNIFETVNKSGLNLNLKEQKLFLFKKKMNEFSIELNDLNKILDVQLTHSERNDQLNRIGGVQGLCESLNTDPETGMISSNEADLKARKDKFGQNVNVLCFYQPQWFIFGFFFDFFIPIILKFKGFF